MRDLNAKDDLGDQLQCLNALANSVDVLADRVKYDAGVTDDLLKTVSQGGLPKLWDALNSLQIHLADIAEEMERMGKEINNQVDCVRREMPASYTVDCVTD